MKGLPFGGPFFCSGPPVCTEDSKAGLSTSRTFQSSTVRTLGKRSRRFRGQCQGTMNGSFPFELLIFSGLFPAHLSRTCICYLSAAVSPRNAHRYLLGWASGGISGGQQAEMRGVRMPGFRWSCHFPGPNSNKCPLRHQDLVQRRHSVQESPWICVSWGSPNHLGADLRPPVTSHLRNHIDNSFNHHLEHLYRCQEAFRTGFFCQMRIRKLQNQFMGILIEVKSSVAQAGIDCIDLQGCEVDGVWPGLSEIELWDGWTGLRIKIGGSTADIEPTIAQNAHVVINGEEDRELIIADGICPKRT